MIRVQTNTDAARMAEFGPDIPDTIPEALRATDRWVLWTYQVRNGSKPTKVPRQAADPTKGASVTAPSTWTSFDEAVAARDRAEKAGGWGLGFVLGDGWAGVDLDACRDLETGVIEPWAQSIIDAINSYTEVSPSGTGIHLYVTAPGLPGDRRRKGGIEMYDGSRYFTVTGAHLPGTPTTIEERTDALAVVYRDVFGDDDRDDDGHLEHHDHVGLDDVELLDRARDAKDGARFSSLYDRGDSSAYGSRSEADLALSNSLAFWTGCDGDRMDRLFRASALMRPKWTSPRKNSTYGLNTIQRAIRDCRSTFRGSAMPDLYISGEEPTADAPAPDDHFLGRYIRYGDGRTDASHEYHEGVGLALQARKRGSR